MHPLQHDGEGILIAVLSPPQFRDDRFLGHIADQMVSADSFHRPDSAGTNGPGERRERILSGYLPPLSVEKS